MEGIAANRAPAAYFNATFEDLKRAGESLENVTQLTGGGYLASIGVYHELHCVVSGCLSGYFDSKRIVK